MDWRTSWQRKWNHDCSEKGCWRDQYLPDLTVFDDCFPRRIGFGDVDGIVERNGRLLILELKSLGQPLTDGQRIMHERLSQSLGEAYQAVVIWGAPDFTRPLKMQMWIKGQSIAPQAVSLDEIKKVFRDWFKEADRQQ